MDSQDEIVTEFLTEANEFLDALERDLVAVEGGKDPLGAVAESFRAFHTLKGTAGFLGFDRLRKLAHAGEDLLSAIRDMEVAWERSTTDALLEVLDLLRRMVADITRGGAEGEVEGLEPLIERLRLLAAGKPPLADAPPAPPVESAPPAAELPAPSFRPAAPAPSRKAPPGPAAAARPPPVAAPIPSSPAPAPVAPSAPAPPAAARPAAAPVAEVPAEISSLRVPVAVLDRLMNLVGELVLARNQLLCHEAAREDPQLTATSHLIHQLTAGLQESVMKARMQPIDTVLQRLPRVCRDAAQLTGKRVRLVTTGQETELDKTLLEAIKDPLGHVVRNAVDHGIERPEVRQARGKPAEGLVTLRARHDGGQVIVEVEDDGAGVDLDRVRQKAVANGWLAPEAAARLGEREVIDLLFRPGFSTAESVTAISGRGVGMDVVRTNVERIGGSVELRSRPGRGTTLVIRVPLTLVIVPSLIVASGKERYAIPQSNLVELVRIGPEREAHMVVDVQGALVLRLRGQVLPLVDLGRLLRAGDAARAGDGARQVVVLQAQGHQFGLLVDEVADTEEIVVKPLGRQLQGLGIFSGATVRGDGRVALVLDVQGLARRTSVMAEGAERAAAADGAGRAAARRLYLVLEGRDQGRQAIELGAVTRLEDLPASQVERVGEGEAVQYRGAILPLVRVSRALPERRRRPRVEEPPPAERVQIVVQEWRGRPVGLLVDRVLDVVEEAEAALDRTQARPGVAGCAVIQGRITEVLDTAALLEAQLAAEAAAEVPRGR